MKIIAIGFLFIFVNGCSNDPTTVQTSKGTFTVPGIAYIDGRDFEASPPLTIQLINIYDEERRYHVNCKLFHGDEVKLLDYKKTDRYYFEVQRGSCTGWIPEHFLSVKKEKAIGDFVKL